MADFYIAPTGSDTSGSGSIGSPWRTIGKFLAAAGNPGDTLYCRGGTYQGADIGDDIVFNTGTSGSRITVRNYPGEVPAFTGGGSTPRSYLLWFKDTAAYVTVRGLKFVNWYSDTSGILTSSGASPNFPHHLIWENCVGNMNVLTDNEHGMYIGDGVHDVIIRGNELVGNSIGSGFELFHSPGQNNILVTNNLLRGWTTQAMQVWETNANNIEISWNTFIGNTGVNIDVRFAGTGIIVRNNIGDASASTDIYNPNGVIDTLSNNYWDLALTGPDYAPVGPAINGAHDGSNAGWTRPTAEGASATPTTKALTLTRFAPTVTAVAHRVVTPTTKALELHTFAPSLDSSVQFTPSPAALHLATFQPDVYFSQSPTPPTSALTFTTYAPRIKIVKRHGKPLSSKSIGLTITSPTLQVTV